MTRQAAALVKLGAAKTALEARATARKGLVAGVLARMLTRNDEALTRTTLLLWRLAAMRKVGRRA